MLQVAPAKLILYYNHFVALKRQTSQRCFPRFINTHMNFNDNTRQDCHTQAEQLLKVQNLRKIWQTKNFKRQPEGKKVRSHLHEMKGGTKEPPTIQAGRHQILFQSKRNNLKQHKDYNPRREGEDTTTQKKRGRRFNQLQWKIEEPHVVFSHQAQVGLQVTVRVTVVQNLSGIGRCVWKRICGIGHPLQTRKIRWDILWMGSTYSPMGACLSLVRRSSWSACPASSLYKRRDRSSMSMWMDCPDCRCRARATTWERCGSGTQRKSNQATSHSERINWAVNSNNMVRSLQSQWEGGDLRGVPIKIVRVLTKSACLEITRIYLDRQQMVKAF